MKFRTVRKEFELSDDSGYAFHVVLEHDGEYGWAATTSISSHGYMNEQGALSSLATTVERFLVMLKEVQP